MAAHNCICYYAFWSYVTSLMQSCCGWNPFPAHLVEDSYITIVSIFYLILYAWLYSILATTYWSNILLLINTSTISKRTWSSFVRDSWRGRSHYPSIAKAGSCCSARNANRSVLELWNLHGPCLCLVLGNVFVCYLSICFFLLYFPAKLDCINLFQQ